MLLELHPLTLSILFIVVFCGLYFAYANYQKRIIQNLAFFRNFSTNSNNFCKENELIPEKEDKLQQFQSASEKNQRKPPLKVDFDGVRPKLLKYTENVSSVLSPCNFNYKTYSIFANLDLISPAPLKRCDSDSNINFMGTASQTVAKDSTSYQSHSYNNNDYRSFQNKIVGDKGNNSTTTNGNNGNLIDMSQYVPKPKRRSSLRSFDSLSIPGTCKKAEKDVVFTDLMPNFNMNLISGAHKVQFQEKRI